MIVFIEVFFCEWCVGVECVVCCDVFRRGSNARNRRRGGADERSASFGEICGDFGLVCVCVCVVCVDKFVCDVECDFCV